MKYEIKNRFTGAVQFECELSAELESESGAVRLGAAVKLAIKAGADLAGANLADAYLAGADLAGANLAGAYLAGADLAGANLAGAYLAGAYLAGADLAGANLAGANLARSYLAGAYLAGADLAGADLAGADLARSYLAGAYLARSYLADAYLAGAYLAGADLAGADLARSYLADADLAGAITTPPTKEEIERLDAVREIVLKNTQRLQMNVWHSNNWTPEHTPEEEHTCGSAHCIAGWLQALSPDESVRKMSPSSAGALLAPASVYMFTQSDSVALQWLKDRTYAKNVAVQS